MARSYLICTIQRTGSWLLAHALQGTGVAGIPAEYFHHGDTEFWAQRWNVDPSDDNAYFAAMRAESTNNGVFGSKMMWNYFEPARARMRRVLRVAEDRSDERRSDPEVLEIFLPDLAYVWLRRRDSVRHAISHWRAVTTGQYALAHDAEPAPPPAYDDAEITRFREWHQAWEAGWRRWFDTHGIVPLELVYEDLVDDVDASVRAVLAHLGLEEPSASSVADPRLRRQADATTEEYAKRYESGRRS